MIGGLGEKLFVVFPLDLRRLFVKRGLLIKYLLDLKYKIAADYDNLLKLLFDKEVEFRYVS